MSPKGRASNATCPRWSRPIGHIFTWTLFFTGRPCKCIRSFLLILLSTFLPILKEGLNNFLLKIRRQCRDMSLISLCLSAFLGCPDPSTRIRQTTRRISWGRSQFRVKPTSRVVVVSYKISQGMSYQLPQAPLSRTWILYIRSVNLRSGFAESGLNQTSKRAA